VAGELVSGQMVGPYRLLFRLGKGGMGEVWAAQRGGQFGFERLVALKLLRGAAKDSNAAVILRRHVRHPP
jgi:serine/threonine-protein kinase